MNNKRLRVSIIIPTHNRKNSLREALCSLTRLDYSREQYEVIVIDDGSSDGTEEMLAKMQGSLSYLLRYGKLRGKRGSSAARNLGMQMAKGEIFVFTDDDCLFDKGWLTMLLAAFDSHKVGVVGGPDFTREEASFFSICVGYLFTSFIGTGGLRRGDRFRVGRYYPKGCNMAMSREAIDKVGGFDELLGVGEEIELGYRIEKGGFKIKYAPSAFIWHKRKGTLKEYLRKIYRIGYTRVILARKHRGLLEIGHMIPFVWLLMVFCFLFLSLARPSVFSLLLLLTSIYFLIVLVSGVQAFLKIKDIRALFVIPLLIPLHHATHGIGFLIAGVKHLLRFKSIYLPK
ncbi:MAG: glycosyltransferase [Candidatus Hodarchaeota archaeon]